MENRFIGFMVRRFFYLDPQNLHAYTVHLSIFWFYAIMLDDAQRVRFVHFDNSKKDSKLKKVTDHSNVIKVIKRVARSGNNPSLRNLRLGNPSQHTLQQANITTIPQLVIMEKEDVQKLLSGHKNPEQDIALIEAALFSVGLKFNMTNWEYIEYVAS